MAFCKMNFLVTFRCISEVFLKYFYFNVIRIVMPLGVQKPNETPSLCNS